VLRLPTGDPQGDLYDQRDRVGELQPAQTHAASRRVPQRRGTDQTAVLGATQHQQEMDDADPRLEGSTEPIYDPIRGKASSAVNPIAGDTKICTPSVTLEAEQHPVSVVVNLYFRVVHRIAKHQARNSQLALGQLSLMALRPDLDSRLPQTTRIGPHILQFDDNLIPAIAAVERTAGSHTVWW